ncbi:hypothetical protein PFISCL1PPCAC_14506, partial [Pristionchus fissidentatus]
MTVIELDVFWLSFMPVYHHLVAIRFQINMLNLQDFEHEHSYSGVTTQTSPDSDTAGANATNTGDNIVSHTTFYYSGALIFQISQLITPLTIQIGPLIMYNVAWVTKSLQPGVINAGVCVQLTHTSVHTIVLLITTPSYRQAML